VVSERLKKKLQNLKSQGSFIDGTAFDVLQIIPMLIFAFKYKDLSLSTLKLGS
jgi:hypothetical protein